MVRPTLIDLNLFELKYYSFIISLDKCTGSYNYLSPKICVPKETKDINVKTFNKLTNKSEAKTMTKHILCDCKYKFNNKTRWNPSTCICENSKYLKSFLLILQ